MFGQGTRALVAQAAVVTSGIGFFGMADQAAGQVIPSGPATIARQSVGHTDEPSTGYLVGSWDDSTDVQPGGQPTATFADNTLRLRSDVTLMTDIDDVGRFDYMGIAARQDFTLGAMPVNMSLTFSGDVDVINGGGAVGSTGALRSQFNAFAFIFATLPDGTPASSALFMGTELFETVGNSAQDTFINFTHETTTLTLAPGYNYTLYLQLGVTSETPLEQPSGWFPAGVTLEAGSLTGNEGLAVTMNWTALPEPALATLAAPMALLLRRQRRSA